VNNEELLQQVLSMTIERFGKQANAYESEIANLNAQILVLNNKVNELSSPPAKTKGTQEEA
jgi:prefoldin subunit 5